MTWRMPSLPDAAIEGLARMAGVPRAAAAVYWQQGITTAEHLARVQRVHPLSPMPPWIDPWATTTKLDARELDAPLPFDEASWDLLSALRWLAPYGLSQPGPSFGLLGARLLDRRTRDGKVSLWVDDGSHVRRFDVADSDPAREEAATVPLGSVAIAYRPRPRQWGGAAYLRLELVDLAPWNA